MYTIQPELPFNDVANAQDWLLDPQTHSPEDMILACERFSSADPEAELPPFGALVERIIEKNNDVWPTKAYHKEHGLCLALRAGAEGIGNNLARKGKPRNPYHGPLHVGSVFASGNYLSEFLKKRISEISGVSDETLNNLLLKSQVACVFHDSDHPGGKNSADKIFEFELIHAQVAADRMRQQGCSKDEIDDVRLMILTTSVNGGAQYVKRAALALARGQKLDHDSLCADVWATLPDNAAVTWQIFKEQMEGLRPLCEDRKDVILPALLVHIADVFPSILAPVPGAVNLSREHREHYGEKALDFNTYGARQYFLKNVVEIDLLREIFPELSAFDVAFDPKWRGYGYSPFDEQGNIVRLGGLEIKGHA